MPQNCGKKSDFSSMNVFPEEKFLCLED